MVARLKVVVTSGNREKAIEEYEKAVKVAPDEGYTSTARQRLAELKKAG